jgi:ribosomal protein S18 acetylase RimI-like enzyme
MTTDSPATIRPATTDDIPAIAALYVELNEHHARIQPGNPRNAVTVEQWTEVARSAFEGEGDQVLVAESGDEVVGFVRLSFVDRPWGRACDVRALSVTREWRGRGVGRSLMAAAEAAAASAGAGGVRLDVQSGNEDATSFYRRLGYEPFATRYGKMLGR